MNVASNNPNATVAFSSTGVGVVLVYTLGLFGITMPAEVAVVLSGFLTTVVLFIGTNGLKGCCGIIWRGNKQT